MPGGFARPLALSPTPSKVWDSWFGPGSISFPAYQNVYVNLGVGAIPSGADVVKAVIYWYDPRTVFAPPVGVDVPDDIDLRLERYDVSSWKLVQSSLDAYEPRERVYADSLVNQYYRLKISGVNVTADTVGCGTNSMKVYYAWMYEDSARNDADGPGTEIDPE